MLLKPMMSSFVLHEFFEHLLCVCVRDPGTASHCVAIIELSKLLMFHKYNASEWIS